MDTTPSLSVIFVVLVVVVVVVVAVVVVVNVTESLKVGSFLRHSVDFDII